jgi:hypothetical protein
MNNKYITLKESGYDWYFTDPEIKVLEDDLVFIKPLTEDYSKELWTKYISKKKNERHFMILQKGHWCTFKNTLLYLWNEDWKNNDYINFSKILVNNIDYCNNDDIILFWMKERAVEIKWSIFIKYWINFLFEDEGVIIINEKNIKSIIMSNGNSWIVNRQLPTTADNSQ